MNEQGKAEIRRGLVSVFPVIIGYLPVAIGFGLLAKNTEISFVDTSLFSIIIYAGASQFMALDLILAGVSTSSIIMATFLLNLRHLMMTASLSLRLDGIKRSFLPIIAFGVTDETFSVLSFTKEKLSLPFILVLNTLAYMTWVGGTMLGYLVGEILPQSLQDTLSIGLYAMFAALLFPQFKGNKNILKLAIITAIIYIIIFYSKILTSGWDIIIGIVLASALGAFVFDEKKEVEES